MYSDNDLTLYFKEYLEYYSHDSIRGLLGYIQLRERYLKDNSHRPHDTQREKKRYTKSLDLIERDIFLDEEEKKALNIIKQAVNRRTSTTKDIKDMTLKKIHEEFKSGDVEKLISDAEQYLKLNF